MNATRTSGKLRPPLLFTRSAFGILKDAAEQGLKSEWAYGPGAIAMMPEADVRELIADKDRHSESLYGCPGTEFYALDPKKYFKGPSLLGEDEISSHIASGSLTTINPYATSFSEGEAGIENNFFATRRFMLIAVSNRPPSDAFVSVKQDGNWFYILNDDEISKKTLALITQFDTILAVPSQSPPLTPSISVGAR
jgi:hypothetical protein